jgi:hypothetical protein
VHFGVCVHVLRGPCSPFGRHLHMWVGERAACAASAGGRARLNRDQASTSAGSVHRQGACGRPRTSSVLTLPPRPPSPNPPATCPVGLHANASNVCSPCPVNCSACTSATACTSCDAGAKLVNGACQGAGAGGTPWAMLVGVRAPALPEAPPPPYPAFAANRAFACLPVRLCKPPVPLPPPSLPPLSPALGLPPFPGRSRRLPRRHL